MPLWLAGLLPRLGGRLAIIAGAALAVILVLLGARNSGRQAERVEQAKRNLESVRIRHDVEDAVRRAGPGVAAERLRNEWSRD